MKRLGGVKLPDKTVGELKRLSVLYDKPLSHVVQIAVENGLELAALTLALRKHNRNKHVD